MVQPRGWGRASAIRCIPKGLQVAPRELPEHIFRAIVAPVAAISSGNLTCTLLREFTQ